MPSLLISGSGKPVCLTETAPAKQKNIKTGVISVGYNVVSTEMQKIFKKYLTLNVGRDIVLQNVKTKQSSTLTSAHVRCGSGLYAHMDFPCISGYNG